MTLTLIWAMSENRVIGRDGGLPWHLPDDLAHFMRATRGHPVIMGRRTYESVGAPLPGRTNVVVTRDPTWRAEGVTIARDVAAAVAAATAAPGGDEVFVCGGADVYRATLPLADRLNVTLVHGTVDGDTHFPEFDWAGWRLVSEQRHDADARHALPFSFRLYERAG